MRKGFTSRIAIHIPRNNISSLRDYADGTNETTSNHSPGGTAHHSEGCESLGSFIHHKKISINNNTMKLPTVAIFLISLFLTAGKTTAQTLPEILQQLADALQEVSDEKTTYVQKLDFGADNPWRVTFTVREIAIKDGKEIRLDYELNLADLDKNLVRNITTSKMLGVSAGTRRTVKAIKHFKDGVQQSYQSDLKLHAKDSENMDKLQQLLKAAIPLAEALWESTLKIDLNSLPEMIAWLGQNIGTVAVGDDVHEQTLAPDGREDLVKLAVSSQTKKGAVNAAARFSLGDLQEQRISYKVQGNKVAVEAKTRQNLNLVTTEENGEQKNYANEIEILCNDLDEAKRITLVLQKAIPLAEKSLSGHLPKPASTEEALGLIAQHVKAVADGKKETAQSFDGNCRASLSTTVTDDKKTQQYQYHFDFSDMDALKTAMTIKGRGISIGLRTANGDKFIQVYKDGTQENYANSLSIEVPDIETARMLEPCLAYAAKHCEQTVTIRDFQWMADRTAAFTGSGNIAQLLTQTADNTCKYSLGVQTAGSKSTQEELYEFNLKDMDAARIELGVSGKSVTVSLSTKGKQKLINYYKDGKPSYVEKISFAVGDVTVGKVFRDSLRELVKGCQ